MKTYHKISDIFYYDKFLFLLDGNDIIPYNVPFHSEVKYINIQKEKQGYIFVKHFPKDIAERLMR